MKNIRIAAVLTLCLLSGGISRGEAVRGADLPEEAKRLIERGLVAADSKEWSIAAQAFLEAQKLQPLHPKILFNLGFSYLNEGRDVLADLWLRAYLALAPEAANAAQVENEIRRLDVAIEATSEKLIQEAIAQLETLPDPMTASEKEAFQTPADPAAMEGQPLPPDISRRRKNTLGAILFAQTATGRITDASNFAAQMQLTAVKVDSLKRFFGQILVDAGDFMGVENTLKEIQSQEERDLLLGSLVIGEIAAEKLDKAEEHLRLVSSPKEKSRLLDTLILKYVRQLEVEKAEQALKRTPLSDEDRRRILSSLMSGHLKKDHLDNARILAQEILAVSQTMIGEDLFRAAPALAVLGRTEEALALLKKAAPKPREAENAQNTAFSMIQVLCWSGQESAAGPVLDFIRSFKSQNAQFLEKKALISISVEKGDIAKILALAKELPAGERDPLTVSIFWRFVQKELYPEAAKVVLAADSSLVKSRLFLKLANAVAGSEASAQKKEFWAQSLEWGLAAQDVIGLKELARDAARQEDRDFAASADEAARAMTWIELADYFTRVPATSDLKKQVQNLKLKSFDVVPYETALAALDWGRVCVYIRARERND